MNVNRSFESHNVLVKGLILQGEKHPPPKISNTLNMYLFYSGNRS